MAMRQSSSGGDTGPSQLPGDRGGSLLKALSNAGIAVVYCDPGMRIVWYENLPSAWSAQPLGRRLTEILPRSVADQLLLARAETERAANSRRIEICIPNGIEDHWYAVWVELDRAEDKICGVIVTAVDI